MILFIPAKRDSIPKSVFFAEEPFLWILPSDYQLSEGLPFDYLPSDGLPFDGLSFASKSPRTY